MYVDKCTSPVLLLHTLLLVLTWREGGQSCNTRPVEMVLCCKIGGKLLTTPMATSLQYKQALCRVHRRPGPMYWTRAFHRGSLTPHRGMPCLTSAESIDFLGKYLLATKFRGPHQGTGTHFSKTTRTLYYRPKNVT